LTVGQWGNERPFIHGTVIRNWIAERSGSGDRCGGWTERRWKPRRPTTCAPHCAKPGRSGQSFA